MLGVYNGTDVVVETPSVSHIHSSPNGHLVSTYHRVSSRDTRLCVPGRHAEFIATPASLPYTWSIDYVGIVNVDL